MSFSRAFIRPLSTSARFERRVILRTFRRRHFREVNLELRWHDQLDGREKFVARLVGAGRDGERLDLVAGGTELLLNLRQNRPALRAHREADDPLPADGQGREENILLRGNTAVR